MKLEFFSCSKKDFEEFLCEIGDNWRKSALCSTSRSKSEFGGKHPFFHYANLFDRQIEGLAERVKLNARKTLGFFYLLSSTLPQFGERGLEVIEDYLKAKGKAFDRAELLSWAAMVSLDDSGGFLFEGTKEVLLDLFSISKESECLESQLAKTLFHATSLIKRAELLNEENEAEEYAVKLIEEQYAQNANKCLRAIKQRKNALIARGANYPVLPEKLRGEYLDAIAQYESGGVSDYPVESFIIHHIGEISQ